MQQEIVEGMEGNGMFYTCLFYELISFATIGGIVSIEHDSVDL